MPEAISNTSPLLYLHQISVLDWLPSLFGEVWVPATVVLELEEGGRKGCNVPDLKSYEWINFVEPQAMPSEWLALDLGPGELAMCHGRKLYPLTLALMIAVQRDGWNFRPGQVVLETCRRFLTRPLRDVRAAGV